MASWITHLRIAEALQCEQQYPSYRYFLIGNVAPDSGRPNGDGLTYSPGKEISHFRNGMNPKWRIEDLRYYRSYILPNTAGAVSEDELCFHYGYFSHLIADALASFFVYRSLQAKFKEPSEENSGLAGEISRDWHGLDVEYLYEHKNCEVFETFKSSFYALDCLEYYPKAYIQGKMDEIKNNFDIENGFVRTNKYFFKKDLDLFTALASKLVLDVLNNMGEIELKYAKSAMEYLEGKYDFLSGMYGDINQAASRLR